MQLVDPFRPFQSDGRFRGLPATLAVLDRLGDESLGARRIPANLGGRSGIRCRHKGFRPRLCFDDRQRRTLRRVDAKVVEEQRAIALNPRFLDHFPREAAEIPAETGKNVIDHVPAGRMFERIAVGGADERRRGRWSGPRRERLENFVERALEACLVAKLVHWSNSGRR
jgi:hypothetical protein